MRKSRTQCRYFWNSGDWEDGASPKQTPMTSCAMRSRRLSDLSIAWAERWLVVGCGDFALAGGLAASAGRHSTNAAKRGSTRTDLRLTPFQTRNTRGGILDDM